MHRAAAVALSLLCCACATAADEVVDRRDGQSYATTQIGARTWFAENLNYVTPLSRCYDNDARHCDELGRLYLHEEALHACPRGWRLPTEEDWAVLEAAIGLTSEEIAQTRGRGAGAGDRLKPGGDTGFNALFAGYIDPHENDASRRLDETAAFWSATPAGADDVSPTAWHRDVAANRDVIWRSPVNVTYRLSVRCVQDRG